MKRLDGRGDVYNYDNADQVTQVRYDALNPDTTPSNPQNTVNYVYDKTGNRSRVTANGVSARYTANVLNQYTLVGGLRPTYDQAGNLTALGDGSYGYDAQNRMISATATSNTVYGYYDARNRCVARSINGHLTVMFYDGWNLAEETTDGGASVAYVHGPRTDELVAKITATNTVYYHADVLGNVTHLTDENGNVVEQYKYDVFGNPTILSPVSGVLSSSAYGNRFLFTGREWLAEIGLYDYRNRMYSPILGRFMQPDPLGFDAGDVNIYRYCGNDTVNLNDPSGLMGRPTPPRFGPRPPPEIVPRPRTPPAVTPRPPPPIDMTDPSTWPKPPSPGPFKPGPPSRCKPSQRGEKSLYDPDGGEWRPHSPDKRHDDFHWDYKGPGKDTPLKNIPPIDPNLLA